MDNSELLLEGSLKGVERPEILAGLTYKAKVPNGQGEMMKVYITINDFNGRTFEVFINSKDKNCYARLSLGMINISTMLREDVGPEKIIDNFLEITDSSTGHMAKIGDMEKGFYCESLEARIGRTLKYHVESHGINGLIDLVKNQEIKVKK